MLKKVFFVFLFLCFFCLVEEIQADIVLKILIVNPSKEQPQKVPVKAYLPKEAKPEDIIDKGDLEVGYDTQQGSYYVYGEYELKPLETLEKEIELRDIWVIPPGELESLRLEAEKINKLLKNTEFAERIKFLYHTIITKLNEVEQRQKVPKANPEDHISQYRNNLQLLDSAKADLAVARAMLNKARPFSTAVIWKLILFILIFLGILGLSFYLLWQKQVGFLAAKGAPQEEKPGEFKPKEERKAEEGKKEVKSEDIEKILRGE